MEKKLYQQPEMEVVKLIHKSSLLETSGENPGGGGSFCPTEGGGQNPDE